jgi:hypothetical protein
VFILHNISPKVNTNKGESGSFVAYRFLVNIWLTKGYEGYDTLCHPHKGHPNFTYDFRLKAIIANAILVLVYQLMLGK